VNYKRYLNLSELLGKKSLLLLGPRQVGKSTLLQAHLPESAMLYNLAEADTYRELSAAPELIRQRLKDQTTHLFIDEAQRLPELFDEVQSIIDRNPSLRVVLTGSSARKLRRTGINLLPGRIWRRDLFPLVFPETGPGRIADRLVRGSLPAILDSALYKDELRNYVGLYLDEEIRAEGLVRGVGNFSRFLPVAALSNGQQIHFTEIASDTGIKVNTVRSYFEILEDTLIGSLLPSFRNTPSRKTVATPKFYFFDHGIVNALRERFDIGIEGEPYGGALEHLIFLELRAFLSYSQDSRPLTYWRTHSQLEVDFLLGDEVAIEVKSSKRVTERDEKGLRALQEDVALKRRIIVCNERIERRSDSGVEIMPVEAFLSCLWSGEV
jgi:predicted AAA+ superfamily ATPase